MSDKIYIDTENGDGLIHIAMERPTGGKVWQHQQSLVDQVLALQSDDSSEVLDRKSERRVVMVSPIIALAMSPGILRLLGRYNRKKRTTWAPCTECGNPCRTGKCFKCQQKAT